MMHLTRFTEEILRRGAISFDRATVIEQNRSHRADSRFALLVFLDGRAVPDACIKATTGNPDGLETSYRNLNALHAASGESFRTTIPNPYWYGNVDRYTVLLTSTVPGTSMKQFPPDRYFSSDAFRRHFERIADWQCSLAKVQIRDRSSGRVAASDAVERYRRTHAVSGALDRLFDECVDMLSGSEVPSTPTHGDFCTANVLVTEDDRIGVIDWEYPLLAEWPLSDIVYFISSIWAIPRRRDVDGRAENYRTLFFKPNRFTPLIRSALNQLCTTLAMAPELILPLTAIAWTSLANRKRAEREEAASTDTDATWDDWNMPLILVQDNACLNLELLARHRTDFLRL